MWKGNQITNHNTGKPRPVPQPVSAPFFSSLPLLKIHIALGESLSTLHHVYSWEYGWKVWVGGMTCPTWMTHPPMPPHTGLRMVWCHPPCNINSHVRFLTGAARSRSMVSGIWVVWAVVTSSSIWIAWKCFYRTLETNVYRPRRQMEG